MLEPGFGRLSIAVPRNHCGIDGVRPEWTLDYDLIRSKVTLRDRMEQGLLVAMQSLVYVCDNSSYKPSIY